MLLLSASSSQEPIYSSSYFAIFCTKKTNTITERSSIEQGTWSFSEYLSAMSDIYSEMLAFLAVLCLKIISLQRNKRQWLCCYFLLLQVRNRFILHLILLFSVQRKQIPKFCVVADNIYREGTVDEEGLGIG
jgi:hypothetical protein